MRINFDFGDLEAFLAVMETASFHLAAEQLHLSQSAVTRRIQKLEQVLGSKLFERTTRAVKPTLAAKRLQSRAEEMLDNAEETTLAMRDESVAFAHQKGAVVTIAMIPTLIAPLFLPGLSSMRQADETARIRLMDLSANDVAEAVSSGEADFGICSIGSLEANTHFEPWFDDEIVLAIPIEHQLAAQDNVSWPDLLNEDLILPARGTGNRLLIDDAMAKGRISAQWTYEVGRSTTAMEMVSGGVGIALLPRSAATSTFAQGLRFKKLPKPVVTRPIGLLTRMGVSDTPVVSSVKDSLREYAANI
ncbi:LysR family transcriptional regulator [Roseibium alexandrii]|uniref:Transcriptional regulator n=1 Tax=Roseibium alexandrii (strain DSM 17067 / NCIMB 14079 / DFL-11) TaxID=244592 RepID=A0A5E8H016_ROSAD|nr:LysR family transcriptional regulator [Roseibium alexandrii]EEE45233.1 Transcriptional regulator [Roseibium alexandrii DFL-11]